VNAAAVRHEQSRIETSARLFRGMLVLLMLEELPGIGSRQQRDSRRNIVEVYALVKTKQKDEATISRNLVHSNIQLCL